MTRTPAPAVWIVDDDLGFVWWLGEIFLEAGCRPLPALSCQDAVALIRTMGVEPDLIILNPHLSGSAALLQRRARAKGPAKIVTIGAPPQALLDLTSVVATWERPPGSAAISRSEWLRRVRKLLKDIKAIAATG